MEHLYADLHVHTTYSDGTMRPAEAVRYAAGTNIAAISITDHDTVDGIPEAVEEGKRAGVEVIPGIELSAELHEAKKSEMHLLGYYINWENGQLRDELELMQKSRRKRALDIIGKLRDLGIRLDEDRLRHIAGTGVIGRLHIAKTLIEQGVSSSINDAFFRFLGMGKPAYVPKLRLKPEEAVHMIRRVGGIPVLAHPYHGHYTNKNLLKGLIRDGLLGIEVWHNTHPPASVEMFRKLAAEMGLLMTGGSDCHGAYGKEQPLMGTVRVPYAVVDGLKECKKRIDEENSEIFT